MNRDKPKFSFLLLLEVSCVRFGSLFGISLLSMEWDNRHVLLHKNIQRVQFQEWMRLGYSCTAFETHLKLVLL